jgi:hypothetical protein
MSSRAFSLHFPHSIRYLCMPMLPDAKRIACGSFRVTESCLMISCAFADGNNSTVGRTVWSSVVYSVAK